MTVKETTIKNTILKALWTKYPDAWVWKISDRFYSGVPDLLVILYGRHYFFEIKTPTGTWTKLQKYTINAINKAGGRAFVVKSAKDVMDILKSDPRN